MKLSKSTTEFIFNRDQVILNSGQGLDKDYLSITSPQLIVRESKI